MYIELMIVCNLIKRFFDKGVNILGDQLHYRMNPKNSSVQHVRIIHDLTKKLFYFYFIFNYIYVEMHNIS